MKEYTGFLIFCLSITFLGACKKDKTAKPVVADTTAYSMNFSDYFDTLSYNTCFITQGHANNSTQSVILGYKTINNTASTNSLQIDLYTTIDNIKTGQVFHVSNTFLQPGSMDLFFNRDSLTTYSTQNAQPDGTVTITAITATEIKGTFSAGTFDEFDFKAVNGSGYPITNGTFVAKRE